MWASWRMGGRDWTLGNLCTWWLARALWISSMRASMSFCMYMISVCLFGFLVGPVDPFLGGGGSLWVPLRFRVALSIF